MPIKVPDHLPAKDILSKEKIFLMDESRAFHQDIRPLQIAILNLMPLKEDTEVQLLRKLGNTPIQVEVVLIHPKDHVSKNTPAEHLINFYKTFDEIKNNKYDGMIITGAPIENMEFEQVHYWNEISGIMEWTNTNVFNTFHICWGAQAGLYYHYNVPKIPLEKKLFGVFSHNVVQGKECNQFVRGFDDVFYVPHSRHTSICVEDVEKVKELEILAVSPEAGLYLAASKDGSKLFVTGHSEYNRDTLDKEYKRDIGKGLAIDMPLHYYLRDDTNSIPQAIWRAHGNLLYSNWLNYVYQETPYEMENIGKDRK